MSKHTSVVAMACCITCREEYEALTPAQHCGQPEPDLRISVENTVEHAEKQDTPVVPAPIKHIRGTHIKDADIKSVNWGMAKIQQKYGDLFIKQPTFYDFIGADAVEIFVDGKKKRFVIYKRDGKKGYIGFREIAGRQIIQVLLVTIPSHFSAFQDSKLYKDLSQMGLGNFLTKAAKSSKRKARDSFIVSALTNEDTWLFENGICKGPFHSISLEDFQLKYTEVREIEGEETRVLRDGVDLRTPKDTRLDRVGTQLSLFRKQSGSSDLKKLAVRKKKDAEYVLVAKKFRSGGYVSEVLEKIKTVVMDDVCYFDAGGKPFPFGDLNDSANKLFFTEVKVMHSETGSFEVGRDYSAEPIYKTYRAYTKSPSQQRQAGANAYDSLKTAVEFFDGNGMNEQPFSEPVKIYDPVKGEMVTVEGYYQEDVGKSYKRFNLGGANGLAPEKGFLAKFSKKHKVTFKPSGEGMVHGELKPETYILTAADGETLTIVKIKDFWTRIQHDQPFLVNVLNRNLEYQGPEVFKEWNDPTAQEEILNRNLTDGSYYVGRKVIAGLREDNIINSFDAHQGRIFVGQKGAGLQRDDICDFFGADIVLTGETVKSKRFLHDLQRNGLQYFVVGQRKDGPDGVHLASQASQLFMMDETKMKKLVDATVEHAQKAVQTKDASEILTWLNGDNEDSDKDLGVVQFVNLAKEKPEILDEQWVMNEYKTLVIKRLNKMLDAKVFIKRARNRYMFSDPVAIFNAIKAGRYEVLKEDAVLQPYEVVCPSKRTDGSFYMEEGEGVSIRFPASAPHGIPVVTGVAPAEYQEYVAEGLGQGCVFYDVFTWVVDQQEGADYDGDTAEIAFGEEIVEAVKEAKSKPFGGLPMLPMIDAYVVRDEDGKLVYQTDKTGKQVAMIAKGCPSYVPADAKAKAVKKWVQHDIFEVLGNIIMFKQSDFEGANREVNRLKFLQLRAEIARNITMSSIEKSIVGVIANRIMILMDLLSRNVLSNRERVSVERDVINLCNGGRWELDRPKKGGTYVEMPLFKELFGRFSPIHFDEEQLLWTLERKKAYLQEQKGHYWHIFEPIIDWKADGKPIIGYRALKPEWLAAQKSERGIYNEDSPYQRVFGNLRKKDIPRSYVQQKIESLCETFKEGHNNTAVHNVRDLVMDNMELDVPTRNLLKAHVDILYKAYSDAEGNRRTQYEDFRQKAIQELYTKGFLPKKKSDYMTKAEMDARIRKIKPLEMEQYADGREVLKGLLKKGLYQLARNLKQDPRALVGALYLLAGEKKTGNTVWEPDGRQYRFSASNGYLYLPFELFADEMYSLLSGPISKRVFTPQDLSFTLIRGSLIPSTDGIRVRVTKPVDALKGQTKYLFRPIRVAVRKEKQQDEQMRTVINFLHKDSTVTELDQVKVEDTVFRGIPRKDYAEGIYELQVERIVFDGTGETAEVYFE